MNIVEWLLSGAKALSSRVSNMKQRIAGLVQIILVAARGTTTCVWSPWKRNRPLKPTMPEHSFDSVIKPDVADKYCDAVRIEYATQESILDSYRSRSLTITGFSLALFAGAATVIARQDGGPTPWTIWLLSLSGLALMSLMLCTMLINWSRREWWSSATDFDRIQLYAHDSPKWFGGWIGDVCHKAVVENRELLLPRLGRLMRGVLISAGAEGYFLAWALFQVVAEWGHRHVLFSLVSLGVLLLLVFFRGQAWIDDAVADESGDKHVPTSNDPASH